jgi:hypothetical protein
VQFRRDILDPEDRIKGNIGVCVGVPAAGKIRIDRKVVPAPGLQFLRRARKRDASYGKTGRS